MRGWDGWLVIAILCLLIDIIDRTPWFIVFATPFALLAFAPRDADEDELPEDRWWQ